MRDIKAHLEKLRMQVAECELIRDLATDPQKKELFARLAEHHKVLAAEIDRVIADKSGGVDTVMGRKTQGSSPKEEEA